MSNNDQLTQDLNLISQRLKTELLDTTPITTANDLLTQQHNNGSWSDIDYPDTSRTHWPASHHLPRLQTLASAYHQTEDPTTQQTYQKAIQSGLEFWVTQDPQCDNWWYNIIHTPRHMGNVLLLVLNTLPQSLQDAAAEHVRRSGFTRTGANLVWEAGNLVTLACAIQDTDLLQTAITKIAEEIKIGGREGIQYDHSFYQHGPQNNIGSYGQSFATDTSRYAALFSGTSFAFPPEKINILSNLIRNGHQWFVWGQQADFHAMGRRVFRSTGIWATTWSTVGYSEICNAMQQADPDHADEYAHFAQRVSGEQPPNASGPFGHKHFWRSDTTIHRAPNFYFSVRMHSTRTYATEVRVNRENLKGYHLSDGVYFLMQRGDEFHGIQPVWDYRKLPGLTYRNTTEPFPYGADVQRNGNSSFVGGVSDGLVGITAFDYIKDDVKARKAYFFTSNGIICLGADITAPSNDHTITSINQCLLKSDVTLLQDNTPTPLTQTHLESNNLQGVYHDGVGYFLLTPNKTILQTDPQSGSWRDIEERAVLTDTYTKDIFSFYIDHDPQATNAQYAYRIIPGLSLDTFPTASQNNAIQILSNTNTQQAIHIPKENITQIVFYEPGAITLTNGSSLQVTIPCLMMLREQNNLLLVSVADPTQEQSQIQIVLQGKYTGQNSTYLSNTNTTAVTINLPQDMYAGQTVSHLLEMQ